MEGNILVVMILNYTFSIKYPDESILVSLQSKTLVGKSQNNVTPSFISSHLCPNHKLSTVLILLERTSVNCKYLHTHTCKQFHSHLITHVLFAVWVGGSGRTKGDKARCIQEFADTSLPARVFFFYHK